MSVFATILPTLQYTLPAVLLNRFTFLTPPLSLRLTVVALCYFANKALAQTLVCEQFNTLQGGITIPLRLDSIWVDQWVWSGTCTRFALFKQQENAKPFFALMNDKNRVLDTLRVPLALIDYKWVGIGGEMVAGFKPGITGKSNEFQFIDLQSGKIELLPPQQVFLNNPKLNLPDNLAIEQSQNQSAKAASVSFNLIHSFMHRQQLIWIICKTEGQCKKGVNRCISHVKISYWIVKFPFDATIRGFNAAAIATLQVQPVDDMLLLRKDCSKWYPKTETVEDLPLWAQCSQPVCKSADNTLYFTALPHIPAGMLDITTGIWAKTPTPDIENIDYCFFQHHAGQLLMGVCIQTGRNFIPGLDNDYYNKKKLVATRIISGHYNFESGFGSPVFLDDDELLNAMPLHFEGETLYVKQLPHLQNQSKWVGVMQVNQYGRLKKYRCE